MKKKTQNKIIYPSVREDAHKWMHNAQFRAGYREERLLLEVAGALEELRKHRKISQAQLAKTLGMKQPAVARMEAGEQNMTVGTLSKVLYVLGAHLEIIRN